MTLESESLLPALRQLRVEESAVGVSRQELLNRLLESDRDTWSIEFSEGIEFTLRGIFDARNIPDDLAEAHAASFTNIDLGLHEHYLQMASRGPVSVDKFVDNLKGKLAEIRAIPELEERFPGHSFSLSPNPSQPVWDVIGVPDGSGEEIFVQVKMRGVESASGITASMEEHQNLFFALNTELRDKILQAHPEFSERLIDLGQHNFQFTEEVKQNLELLKDNYGIDVPDEVGALLPYVAEVVLGIKLIMDLISTEREFKQIQASDRARVHALKILTLMSRYGITSVCTVLGGKIGTAIPVPGAGTAVGAIGGAGLSFYLYRQLRPRMLEVAMKITGVNEDDLFYYQNKSTIDDIGTSLASTSAG